VEEIRVAGKSIEVLVKKGTIDFDFELMKSQLEEVLKMYGGCVFNEDNLAGAKKEIADLRKQQKALDKCRIEVSKDFNSTAEEFGAKMKEAVKLFDKPISELDGQVQIFEEKKKAEKQAKVTEVYNKHCEGLEEYLPIAKYYDSRWNNVTNALSSIEEEIIALAGSTVVSINTIKSTGSDAIEKALEKFKLDLSLANAMTYINQFEQQKAEIEKKAIEQARIEVEERIRKEEREKIQAEQNHQRELEEIDRKAKEELAAAVEQAKSEVKEQAVAEILEVKEFVPNAETQTRTYRISGTNGELEQVEMYINSIGANYKLLIL